MATAQQSSAYNEGYRDGRDSVRPELERWRVRHETSGAAWAIDAERRYAEGIRQGIMLAALIVASVGIVAAVLAGAWHGGGIG